MKIIFLDIDGVLNRDSTKELFRDFTGVDVYLVKKFLTWLEGKDYDVVLSSTWRFEESFMAELRRNGLSWIAETAMLHRYGLNRGWEIEGYLDANPVINYVILDDLHPGMFLIHQRPQLVQTSPVHGLRDKDLKRMEKLLAD